ncbi:MAG: M23 family metallopeptidase [Bacteroidota bacterium]
MSTLSLADPVGRGAPNREDDVVAYQTFAQSYADAWGKPSVHPGRVDGVAGGMVRASIENLQRLVNGGRQLDGRIDPGGFTERAANRHAAIADRALEWIYPFDGPADRSYTDGSMRTFNARRGRYRAHAGTDHWTRVGRPIYAIEPGTVIRVADFYLDTCAVEIEHEGGGIARYGEVDCTAHLTKGNTVRAGDTMGHVGQMRYADGTPFMIDGEAIAMLHFAYFAGLRTGALTQTRRSRSSVAPSGRAHYRRRDLVDVTRLLRRAPYPTQDTRSPHHA